MSGWVIALAGGGVLVLAICGLCVVVLRAVKTTAESTEELGRLLARVQANTDALTKLDQATAAISGAARQISSRLEDLPEQAAEPAPNAGNGRARNPGPGRRTPRR